MTFESTNGPETQMKPKIEKEHFLPPLNHSSAVTPSSYKQQVPDKLSMLVTLWQSTGNIKNHLSEPKEAAGQNTAHVRKF